MRTKTKIRLFAGIVVSIAIIYYTCKAMGGLDPGLLFRSRVNWWLAGVSGVIFAFSNFVRAQAYPKGIDRKIGQLTALRIVGIGHAANLLLPLHVGEGLRLMFFPKSYTTAQKTRLLIVPGIADTLFMILLSLPAIPFSGFQNKTIQHTLQIVLYVLSGAAVALAAAVLLIPSLKRFLSRYMTRDVAVMTVWVFLSWLTIYVSIWIGLTAFHFTGMRAFHMSLAVFAATNIVNFLPSSPGGIGLFEYGVLLGLESLGVPAAQAKTAGLLLHFIQYTAMLPLGAILYLTVLRRKKKNYTE